MNIKRTLSLLLAALLLTGALASCAETKDDDPADTDGKNADTLPEGETELQDNLPDGLNFNGEEINFYSFYEEGMTSGQVTVPDLNGNPVNDAVYERNKVVESRLGVKERPLLPVIFIFSAIIARPGCGVIRRRFLRAASLQFCFFQFFLC